MSSPSTAARFDYANGPAAGIRQQFVDTGRLDRSIDLEQPRRPDDREPVSAFTYDFATGQSGSVLYTVGMTQEPAVNYRTSVGDIELRPWWLTKSCFGDLNTMISQHYQALTATAEAAARWTSQLRKDVASYSADERSAELSAAGSLSRAP